MGFGLGDIFKIKAAWEKFTKTHPRFPMFLEAVKAKGVPEDSILDLCITYPNGEKLETNLKVTKEDLELIDTLSKMQP